MRLDLRFTTRPVEELWCEAAVILVFKIKDRISAYLDSIDKKMGGSIREAIRSGIWSADLGDKLLFATQNSIRADKLLIYGLGNESAYSYDILKREINHLANLLDKIKISEFGFYLAEKTEAGSEYIANVETAIMDLARVFLDKYRDVNEYMLKIFISVKSGHIETAGQIIDRLRNYFSPLSDFSIILDKGTGCNDAEISEIAA
jgi:hypothetical protein